MHQQGAGQRDEAKPAKEVRHEEQVYRPSLDDNQKYVSHADLLKIAFQEQCRGIKRGNAVENVGELLPKARRGTSAPPPRCRDVVLRWPSLNARLLCRQVTDDWSFVKLVLIRLVHHEDRIS